MKHFGASLVAVRASPEMGGGTAGRGFEPSFGCLPVLLSRSKLCHADRLEEGFQMVESSRIVGMAVAGEDDRRVLVTRGSSRATTRPRRVGCLENSGKI